MGQRQCSPMSLCTTEVERRCPVRTVAPHKSPKGDAAVLRRVTIVVDGSEVDVALPATPPVFSYLAALTDIVETRGTPLTTGAPMLSRIDGSVLDLTQSLADSSVADGDMLVLSHAVAQHPTRPSFDAVRGLQPGPASIRWSRPALTALWAGAGIVGVVVAAASGARGTALVVAAVGVTLGGIASRRRDGWLWCIAITVLSGAIGLFAIPGAPAAPQVFLGVTAAAGAAVLSVHVLRCPLPWIVATGVAAGAVSTAALGSVVFPGRLVMTGTAITLVALAGMGCAARIAMLAAGMSAAPPGGQFGLRRPEQAGLARDVTTGLTVGCGLAAGVGVASAALNAARSHEAFWSTAAFGMVVTLALVLRSRLCTGDAAVAALGGGGACAGAVALLLAIRSPSWGACMGALLIASAAAAAWKPSAPLSSRAPVAARVLDLVFYTALAATVPLAVWASDVYHLIRGLDLS